MQIWLDTINLELIKQASAFGIVSGITTNPAILSLAKRANIKETIDQLLDLQTGPVAIQVTAQDSQSILNQARDLFAFSPRILVKIFADANGYAAMRQCRDEAIPVLATGILQPIQALLAANLGATYIAPYFSHLGDSFKARKSLESMLKIVRAGLYQTKVLAASVQKLDDLIFCAELGVDAITIKDALYQELIADYAPLQTIASKFQSAWSERKVDADGLLWTQLDKGKTFREHERV